MEEKRIIKRFMSEAHSGGWLGINGLRDVIRSLKDGVAEMVILTDDINYIHFQAKCKRCGNVQEKFVERHNLQKLKQEITSRPCPSCNTIDLESTEVDIVDYLEELAIMTGAKLEVISAKTEEGAQLASLGKIGAILRFRPMANV